MYTTRDMKLKAAVSLCINQFKKPHWYSIQAWNKRAELLRDYTTKGSLIGVHGELLINAFTMKETHEKRQKLLVEATAITLIKGGKENDD
jgi:single-stranded DNA-binding protein